MKKLSLLLLLAIIGLSTNAQTCIPDGTMLNDSVIISPLPYQVLFPERGLQDTACVNSYFETTLNLRIPGSASVGGLTLLLNSAEMAEEDAVQNLPASMDYLCNPPNCVFDADSLACILIYGTAVEGDVGEHDLKVDLVLNTIAFGPYPLSLPDGTVVEGNYYLNVEEEGSENCTIVDGVDDFVIENFAVYNQPNPFYSSTEMVINAKVSGVFELSVQDMAGKVLKREEINIHAGENKYSFDGSSLSAGMYIFTISDGQKSIANKMLIGNR